MRTVSIAGLVAAAAVAAMIVNLGLLGSAESSSDPVGKLMPASYAGEAAVDGAGGAAVGASTRRRRTHPRPRAQRSAAGAVPHPLALPPHAATHVVHPSTTLHRERRSREPGTSQGGGSRAPAEPRTRTVTVQLTTTLPTPIAATTPSPVQAAAPVPPSPPPTTQATTTAETHTTTAQAQSGQNESHDD